MKLIFIFSLIVLYSYGQSNRELIINFENSHGISTQSEVICNGKTIGSVTDLGQVIKPNISVNIHILLDIEGLPNDSKFIIRERDLLSHAIYVTKGKSSSYFSKSDRITGKIEALNYIQRRQF